MVTVEMGIIQPEMDKIIIMMMILKSKSNHLNKGDLKIKITLKIKWF